MRKKFDNVGPGINVL